MRLRRARPHAGLPVRSARRAPPGLAPHARGRAGDCPLCHGAGHPGGCPCSLRQLPHAGRTVGAGALRLLRGAGLHARTPDPWRAAHAGQHLHGPPPGHDHRGAGQRAAGWRCAALGHGACPHRSRAAAAAGARTARAAHLAGHTAAPAAACAPTKNARPCAPRHPGRPGLGAHTPAGQRALQRHTARQRGRVEPLAPDGHHPLARRCAAGFTWQLSVCAADGLQRARVRHQPPRARCACGVWQHLPHRPRVF